MEFDGLGRSPLEADRSDQERADMRDPETVAAFAAVEAVEAANLGGQRRLDVALEALLHVGRAERAVDRDEEIAHRGVIGLGAGSDRERVGHRRGR
jgi:hypothetical protein